MEITHLMANVDRYYMGFYDFENQYTRGSTFYWDIFSDRGINVIRKNDIFQKKNNSDGY